LSFQNLENGRVNPVVAISAQFREFQRISVVFSAVQGQFQHSSGTGFRDGKLRKGRYFGSHFANSKPISEDPKRQFISLFEIVQSFEKMMQFQ